MDEPLSNLDAKLRVQMRTEIAKLHNRIGTTTIYVTHDQTEAMTMADRIVVLNDGIVQQVASPQQMYEQPVNVFVAGFIGSPAMNFMRARLEKDNGGYAVAFGQTRICLSREIVGESEGLGQYAGKEVVLGVRPEHFEDASLTKITSDSDCITVTPQVIESMGSEKYLYFGVDKEQAAHLVSLEKLTEGEGQGADQGGAEGSGSADNFGELLVARVSAESQARIGHALRLAIDASKIRLFDSMTEKAIL
jgi:multiple sugar transport system ATP-binding protein